LDLTAIAAAFRHNVIESLHVRDWPYLYFRKMLGY